MVGRAVPEQTQVLKYDVPGGVGEPRFYITGESKFDIDIRAEPRCGRNLKYDISGGGSEARFEIAGESKFDIDIDM